MTALTNRFLFSLLTERRRARCGVVVSHRVRSFGRGLPSICRLSYI